MKISGMSAGRRGALEASAHLEPVGARHHHVEQDHVGRLLGGEVERPLTVGGEEVFVLVLEDPARSSMFAGSSSTTRTRALCSLLMLLLASGRRGHARPLSS
jgi:hypothetical protein